jgi:aconitate hydratase
MAPEYGATCGFFPIDQETINYLTLTAREPENIALVEAYAKAQGMWREPGMADPQFTDIIDLDLDSIVPSLAGPKRPQDRVALTDAARSIAKAIADAGHDAPKTVAVPNQDFELTEGDVAIAAITSCTNTSNPSVLVAAGLVARAARARGLTVKPWVKTSLAPGSQVVTDYLNAAGLQDDLDAMGFHLVGYGCTTCIGNSGPLPTDISTAINENNMVVASVLSGNRNFEGRVSPDVIANYLASPPLVVAYAMAGHMRLDITTDALGHDQDGNPVYLRDIWPDNATVKAVMESVVTPDMFASRYGNVFAGTEEWRAIEAPTSQTFDWDDGSTYVRNPPYFAGMTMAVDPGRVKNITGARLLAKLGDSITTDHISPAGSIRRDSPAGDYLNDYQVRPVDFNSYGSRRGNHEVMMRGTFANIRLRNELAPGTTGGMTQMPDGAAMPIYDAAQRYADENTPLIVIGGKEYGTGSSRDWAAKGTALLGIEAVIVESFERIHRSNLIGMGVLPLQFMDGTTKETLGITGDEVFDLIGLDDGVSAKMTVTLIIHRADGTDETVPLLCRIDTEGEAEYYRNGGILPYVLRSLAA